MHYPINKHVIFVNRIEENDLKITLSNSEYLIIDVGNQSCCEDVYLDWDVDPKSLVGQTLLHVDARTIIGNDEYGDPVEEMFVLLQGNQSSVNLKAYNSHNGYYSHDFGVYHYKRVV